MSNQKSCVFEAGKEYKTADGSKARIYATDGAYGSIHGAVFTLQGWAAASWGSTGLHAIDDWDLVKPKVRYVKSMETLLKEYPKHEFTEQGHLKLYYTDSCGKELFRMLYPGTYHQLGKPDTASVADWAVEERDDLSRCKR